MNSLDYIFTGGAVKRYHTRPTIGNQNNAEHSFGVASLVALIDPDCSKELLLHALWHDLAEFQTGDIPATAKWRWPQIKNLLNKIEKELDDEFPLPKISDKEHAILKMADCLETIMFCLNEKKLGNTRLESIIENCSKKIWEVHKKFPNENAIKMFMQIKEF